MGWQTQRDGKDRDLCAWQEREVYHCDWPGDACGQTAVKYPKIRRFDQSRWESWKSFRFRKIYLLSSDYLDDEPPSLFRVTLHGVVRSQSVLKSRIASPMNRASTQGIKLGGNRKTHLEINHHTNHPTLHPRPHTNLGSLPRGLRDCHSHSGGLNRHCHLSCQK